MRGRQQMRGSRLRREIDARETGQRRSVGLRDYAIAERQRRTPALAFVHVEPVRRLTRDEESAIVAFRRNEDEVAATLVDDVREIGIERHVGFPVDELAFTDVLDGRRSLARRVRNDARPRRSRILYASGRDHDPREDQHSYFL